MKYHNYLKSDHWKETKSFLALIDKKECWVCGKTEGLQTHHLHYKTLGYEDGDELVFLCGEHHKRVTFAQDGIKRKFETDRDLALACRKLQSMRSKLGRPLPKDKVAAIANSLY